MHHGPTQQAILIAALALTGCGEPHWHSWLGIEIINETTHELPFDYDDTERLESAYMACMDTVATVVDWSSVGRFKARFALTTPEQSDYVTSVTNVRAAAVILKPEMDSLESTTYLHEVAHMLIHESLRNIDAQHEFFPYWDCVLEATTASRELAGEEDSCPQVDQPPE